MLDLFLLDRLLKFLLPHDKTRNFLSDADEVQRKTKKEKRDKKLQIFLSVANTLTKYFDLYDLNCCTQAHLKGK